VFGVLPNTLRPASFLNGAKPKSIPSDGMGEEVGRETRPTATETVALPNHCSLVGEWTENVGESEVATWNDWFL
jgi:hypothetical protein